MIFDDTIAAISTPAGAGAIAIVRLSGPMAWQIAQKIFSVAGTTTGDDRVPQFKSHAAIHGYIKNPSTRYVLDEVVLIPYQGPNSYTGEDLVEVDCHGSPYVTNALLDLCLAQGARLARPGEFTQRAYLNVRMDLTQAEAVLDLIHSKTERQVRQALSALSGEIGTRISDVRNDLMELLARVVAGIDFPEEVGDIALDDLSSIVDRALERLEVLARTVRSGRFLRQGVRLAIVGKPNAGKSSLLNQLLKFERAIVTDVPGTTRDSLEELLDLNGIPVILVDTAGIRKTDDHVEKIGIERTYKTIESADLALMVADVTTGWTQDDELIAKMLAGMPYILLANKLDLEPGFDLPRYLQAASPGGAREQGVAAAQPGGAGARGGPNEAALPGDLPPAWKKSVAPGSYKSSALVGSGGNIKSPDTARDTKIHEPNGNRLAAIAISAIEGIGLIDLTHVLEEWIFSDTRSLDAGASLNARQGELCSRAIKALHLVHETVANGMPQDCLATDLKTAVDCLSEICGEAVSEEIISNVFANFCIGK
jgi:tRNA modification GTPase